MYTMATLLAASVSHFASAQAAQPAAQPDPAVHAPSEPSAATISSIQQTLSRFSVAIDTKQFQLLDSVFTPTATTNFTGKTIQSGLPAISAYLQNGLRGAVSQHALNTLYVTQSNPNAAHVINFLQGTFFGQGNLTGQILANFGYYEDDMVKGDNGAWLVQNRVLHNFVSIS